MPTKNKQCVNCGVEFVAADYPTRKNDYCSRKCSAAGKSKNAKKMIIKCFECNKEFIILESVHKSRCKNGSIPKYCSIKCTHAEAKRKIKACKECGKEFKQIRESTIFCSKGCQSKNRTGKYLSKKTPGYWYENGYKVLYVSGMSRGIKEHINIIENELGRKLKSNEVVHHIDGGKLNNQRLNLKLMTRSDHSSLHRKCEVGHGERLFVSLRKRQVEDLYPIVIEVT